MADKKSVNRERDQILQSPYTKHLREAAFKHSLTMPREMLVEIYRLQQVRT